MSDVSPPGTGHPPVVSIPSSSGMGVGRRHGLWGQVFDVSIPSSSGMGVGPGATPDALHQRCLNTFFIRYGCRTVVFAIQSSTSDVSIPSSSGMGVGHPYFTSPKLVKCLNTFFIRYGCRTIKKIEGHFFGESQYLLHQVWVSDPNPGRGKS